MNFSEQVMQKTIRIIEQRKYRPGEEIIRQGQEDDSSIYFIEKGSVELYNQNSNEELRILHKGQSFGEISFFTGQRRQIAIRSIEFTTLLAIKRSTFFELVKSSPLDLEKFCMIKDQILLNSRFESIGVYCFCCKSTSHIISQCNFVHLHLDKFKIIKEYAKDESSNRDKTVQRKNVTQNAYFNRVHIEECANLYLEENIDELQQEGWFNDLLKQELQNHIILRNNSTYGAKQMINARTTSLNEYSQKNQTPKGSNQNYQDKIIQSNPQTGFANIKIQYQQFGKSVSGNLREQDYYDTHSNMVSDYTPASTQNLQIQKPTNNLFRRHSVKSEDGQGTLTFNQSRKVQFSVTSLPANETDGEYFGDKSQQLQNQSPQQQQQQLINLNQIPSYYNQVSGQDYNTPTNRIRQHSSNSEKVSSINVMSSNNHINFNTPNYYYSQTSGNNNSNYYANNSNSIQVHSLNTQIQQINNNQQNPQYKAFLTQQISNQSIDFISQQHAIQPQVNTPSNVRINNPSTPSITQINTVQPQKNKEVIHRGSKKRITLKTDVFTKKRPTTATLITKQISNMHEKQTNEGLIRQLQELMQIPNLHVVRDNTPFETLKNFLVYMPHNNHDRVILNYIAYMRKKVSITSMKKTKRSSQRLPESSLLRNGTYASSKKNKMSIQQYKEMLSENLIENDQSGEIKQENFSIKSIKNKKQ